MRASGRRQTPAEIEAGARARMTRDMELAIEEIIRYVSENRQGKIVLSWRPDGQVQMDRTESWHPPRGS